jgi:Flp pilus assembly protein TadD
LSTAEHALRLAPDHPGVQDTLGWILVEQGQAARALDLLRKAADKAPKAATIRYHLAVALANSGKKPEARKELEQLLSSGQKFPETEQAKTLLNKL